MKGQIELMKICRDTRMTEYIFFSKSRHRKREKQAVEKLSFPFPFLQTKRHHVYNK
jgi:hypothetical protein